jgi:hypothetical protein
MQWRVEGLAQGEVALLIPRDYTQHHSVAVAPLAPDPAQVNYYGFRRGEW